MSATHNRSGAQTAAKWRCTRSAGRSAAGSATRGAFALAAADADQPVAPHQPFHRATGRRMPSRFSSSHALRAPYVPSLFSFWTRRISLRAPASLTAGRSTAGGRRARSRWTGRSAYPGARSAPAQIGSTPHRRPPGSRRSCVLADELRDQWDGRSSSAAKKADAAFRIALARFSSAFSRRNRRTSADSSDVVPEPGPGIDLGLPDPLTHRLGVPTPSSSATLPIAAHSDSCSPRTSATIRTARCFSSDGYRLVESPDMTPTFPSTGVSGHAGGIHADHGLRLGYVRASPPRPEPIGVEGADGEQDVGIQSAECCEYRRAPGPALFVSAGHGAERGVYLGPPMGAEVGTGRARLGLRHPRAGTRSSRVADVGCLPRASGGSR